MLATLKNYIRRIREKGHYSSCVLYTSGGFDGDMVGKPLQIGAFSVINYGGDVIFGENVKIGYGVVIVSASTIVGSKGPAPIIKSVIIGDNVEIGSNATILPGIKVGNNATIAAGAVVKDDVPQDSIVAGSPAKVVKWK